MSTQRQRIIITHKECVFKAKPLVSKVINNDFDRTTSTILHNRIKTNINSRVDRALNALDNACYYGQYNL